MKIFFILLLFLQFSYADNLNICSFTFNSINEREVLKEYFTPLGATISEKVPSTSKDPLWFEKNCETTKKCDVILFSGHFGGIFFGEQSTITLSLSTLLNLKNSGKCPKVLDDAKLVFLMGCNTLASKKRDHRSIHQYLNILVADGFPLDLSEKVAATRYLDYGQSNEEIMASIFSNAKSIIGFESTGPLGKHGAPMLKKALMNSSKSLTTKGLIDTNELKKAFRGTSLKIVAPVKNALDDYKNNALILDNPSIAARAWENLLSDEEIEKNLDFIIMHKSNPTLINILQKNGELLYKLAKLISDKFSLASGLSSIQLEFLNFQKLHDMISESLYETRFLDIIYGLTNNGIDYVTASQLCRVFKSHNKFVNELDSRNKLPNFYGIYSDFLDTCMGKQTQVTNTKAMHCLKSKSTYDWACLTENAQDTDLNACKLAAKRNGDVESSDNMLWYCYDRLRENKKLDIATCIELTESFQVLGNQLKMNWNCLNAI